MDNFPKIYLLPIVLSYLTWNDSQEFLDVGRKHLADLQTLYMRRARCRGWLEGETSWFEGTLI